MSPLLARQPQPAVDPPLSPSWRSLEAALALLNVSQDALAFWRPWMAPGVHYRPAGDDWEWNVTALRELPHPRPRRPGRPRRGQELPRPPQQRDWLSESETSRLLQIPTRTLRHWRRRLEEGRYWSREWCSNRPLWHIPSLELLVKPVSTDETPLWLPTHEAADALGVHWTTLYRWRRQHFRHSSWENICWRGAKPDWEWNVKELLRHQGGHYLTPQMLEAREALAARAE